MYFLNPMLNAVQSGGFCKNRSQMSTTVDLSSLLITRAAHGLQSVKIGNRKIVMKGVKSDNIVQVTVQMNINPANAVNTKSHNTKKFQTDF